MKALFPVLAVAAIMRIDQRHDLSHPRVVHARQAAAREHTTGEQRAQAGCAPEDRARLLDLLREALGPVLEAEGLAEGGVGVARVRRPREVVHERALAEEGRGTRALDGPALDAAFHLGDLVGYGPWPDETVALLAERGIEGVAGNYDSTVAADYSHCGCRYEDPRQGELSHRSFEWAKARVSSATRRRLGKLPFRLDVRPAGGHTSSAQLVLVHGTPTLNTLYWDADRSDEFCRRMIRAAGARRGDLIACGHTHVPWQREVDGTRLLNAGSVGRPKDGDPRACYALVDATESELAAELVRVEYDVARATRAIRDSGLPGELATHLERGGAPREGGDDG